MGKLLVIKTPEGTERRKSTIEKDVREFESET